jgi:hypothetical protein
VDNSLSNGLDDSVLERMHFLLVPYLRCIDFENDIEFVVDCRVICLRGFIIVFQVFSSCLELLIFDRDGICKFVYLLSYSMSSVLTQSKYLK